MEVQVIAREFSLTPSLKERLIRRLHFAFSRARSKITRVVVRLGDVNGPRGGRDKMCQVNVAMPGKPEVVIREVQEDLYVAIDGAVHRAAWRVQRLWARKKRKSTDGRPALQDLTSTPSEN